MSLINIMVYLTHLYIEKTGTGNITVSANTRNFELRTHQAWYYFDASMKAENAKQIMMVPGMHHSRTFPWIRYPVKTTNAGGFVPRHHLGSEDELWYTLLFITLDIQCAS